MRIQQKEFEKIKSIVELSSMSEHFLIFKSRARKLITNFRCNLRGDTSELENAILSIDNYLAFMQKDITEGESGNA